MTTHPLRNISWPHSAFPAFISPNQTIELEVVDLDGTIIVELGDRETNTLYELNLVNNYIYEYNGAIPVGLYDLVLSDESGIIDIQTHSVKILDNPPRGFKFVHVTDTHLPSYSEEKPTLEVVTEVFVNITKTNPDFVLLTGDFIESMLTYQINESTKETLHPYESIIELGLEFLDQWDLPIFVIPGNHDLGYIYPNRESGSSIWYAYMSRFIQEFEYGPASFVGYGSLDGMTLDELGEIQEAMDRATRDFKVLYTHGDYDHKIEDNLEELGISLAFHGHYHVSSVGWMNKTLRVGTHNAFEPNKYEPIQGFRIIEMEQPSKLIVDGKSYTFDFPDIEYPDPISETTSADTEIISDSSTSNITETPLMYTWISFYLFVTLVIINKKSSGINKSD
jgi:predicted MPP superfamily phosphohydrolase